MDFCFGFFCTGTSASDVHFQAYLLDGLARWNEDRARQVQGNPPTAASYVGLLNHNVNCLSVDILGKKLAAFYTPPRKYTGQYDRHEIFPDFFRNSVIFVIFRSIKI